MSGAVVSDASVAKTAHDGLVVWHDALHALALFAVDPAGLGGISLRAGPGPVRDHWLTLLRDALPPEAPVRRLPLHAEDERLLGGLDLAATLRAGRPVAQQGLLCEADGGVVLLSMAERLDAGAAARLCAVLDDNAVTLQRDGLSRRLPARIGIVALDEGVQPDERPPAALLDRLAFHVDLTEVSPRDIDDPSWTHGDLRAARQRLLAASVRERPARQLGKGPRDSAAPLSANNRVGSGDGAKALCAAALSLGIRSIRAPLVALRAARVAAALYGRCDPVDADLGLAARLVFVSRATRFPPPEEADAPSEPEPSPSSELSEPEQENRGDTPLPDIVLDAVRAALPPDLLARLVLMEAGRGLARAPGRAGQTKISIKRGRPVGTRQGLPKGGARLHLLETLKAAVPWQVLRRQAAETVAPQSGRPRFEVRRDDFRIIRFRQRIGTTTVFAVDASGSAAMHRLGEAKGAVELLLADCYVRRDQVALLAFRGLGATLLLPPTGSLLRAKRCLAGLPGGGPTPLAAGIDAATTLAVSVRRAGRTPVITLLTDARANIARDGTGGRPRAQAEAMESAAALRAAGVATLLVDTSPRPNPFACRLAEEMRAQYVPLPYADAQALSRAVRSAVAA